MRFDYTAYSCDPSPQDPSGIVYRPTIQVRVGGLKGSFDLLGILDTGADECLLPYELLEEIDPLRRIKDFSVLRGFAGEITPVVYGTVNLTILLKGRPFHWRARVGFVSGRDGEAVWGRDGFLEYFNASFHGPGRHFTLRLKGSPHEPFLSQA